MSGQISKDAFSASDAALEGFQVLRRHWRVVVGWAGFNLMALVAMVVVTAILGLVIVGLAGGDEAKAGSVGTAVGGVVGFLGTLFIEVSVVTALFRLLLRDEAPGVFYLRWGRDEGRLLLVWLSIILIACGVAFVAVGLAAASLQIGAWAPWIVGLAGACFAIWLMTRLSLCGPTTFVTQRLGLDEAWRLSRGRFWPLLGMNALMLCLLAMAALAGWFAIYLLMVASSGFRDWSLVSLSDQEALTEHPGRYLFQLVAELAFAPVLWVISQAPLAAAYQALAKGSRRGV